MSLALLTEIQLSVTDGGPIAIGCKRGGLHTHTHTHTRLALTRIVRTCHSPEPQFELSLALEVCESDWRELEVRLLLLAEIAPAVLTSRRRNYGIRTRVRPDS